MDSIKFLEKIGVLITNTNMVKNGDIVGARNVIGNCASSTFRLYFVKEVCIEEEFGVWLPDVPRIYFLEPHVGVTVFGHKPVKYYIYTPTGYDYLSSWANYSNLSEKDIAEIEADEIFNDIYKKESFDLYLIQDPEFVKLGNLIPKVVMPKTSCLKESDDINKIYSFVDSIIGDIEQLRSITDNMRRKHYE